MYGAALNRAKRPSIRAKRWSPSAHAAACVTLSTILAGQRALPVRSVIPLPGHSLHAHLTQRIGRGSTVVSDNHSQSCSPRRTPSRRPPCQRSFSPHRVLPVLVAPQSDAQPCFQPPDDGQVSPCATGQEVDDGLGVDVGRPGHGVHGEAVGVAVGLQPLTYLQRKASLIGGITG